MEKRLDNTCSLFRNMTKMKERVVEDNECEVYGKLLAIKLRKFNEVEREIVMHEIDNLVYEKRMALRTPNVSCGVR